MPGLIKRRRLTPAPNRLGRKQLATVTIKGQKYIIVDAITPAQASHRGFAQTAKDMRLANVKRSVLLQRPGGTTRYESAEVDKGGAPSVWITPVRARINQFPMSHRR